MTLSFDEPILVGLELLQLRWAVLLVTVRDTTPIADGNPDVDRPLLSPRNR